MTLVVCLYLLMATIIFNATELKVIKLICKQLTAKEIAGKMGLGYRTIESYRSVIQKRIKAKNSIGIALWAVRKGIVKP